MRFTGVPGCLEDNISDDTLLAELVEKLSQIGSGELSVRETRLESAFSHSQIGGAEEKEVTEATFSRAWRGKFGGVRGSLKGPRGKRLGVSFGILAATIVGVSGHDLQLVFGNWNPHLQYLREFSSIIESGLQAASRFPKKKATQMPGSLQDERISLVLSAPAL